MHVCKYCKLTFSRASSVQRHLDTCKIRIDTLETVKLQFSSERQVDKEKIKFLEKQVKINNKTTKCAVSAMKYIVNNFVTTPALTKITTQEIESIIPTTNEKKLINLLVRHNNHKTLVKYIGDAILSLYKKENNTEQQLWNTDVQRLTYVIRTIIEKNGQNVQWIQDAKGQYVGKLIIGPVLQYLVEFIKSFMIPINVWEYEDPEYLLETFKSLVSIQMQIKEDNTLEKDISQYIAPLLKISDHKLIA